MTTQLWTIGPGDVDSSRFFRLLHIHFPDASTLYAEGTSIEPDVQALFKAYAEDGAYLPGAQTIWPESVKFRCRFETELCEKLTRMAEHHAEPELLDHIFLYAGSEVLFEWPDAFSNEMLLPSSFAEERVAKFALSLGLPYVLRKYG